MTVAFILLVVCDKEVFLGLFILVVFKLLLKRVLGGLMGVRRMGFRVGFEVAGVSFLELSIF